MDPNSRERSPWSALPGGRLDIREATREEFARLMVESGRVQYERLPVSNSELSELDEALVRDYFTKMRHVPYPEDADERARLLVNLGFATRHGARVVPPVAGLLLFAIASPRVKESRHQQTHFRRYSSGARSTTGSTVPLTTRVSPDSSLAEITWR